MKVSKILFLSIISSFLLSSAFCIDNRNAVIDRSYLASRSSLIYKDFFNVLVSKSNKKLLNSNKLLNVRLPDDVKLSDYLDSKKINTVAMHYIKYLDHLIVSNSKNTFRVKILFHDDMDGVASAIIVKSFLDIYFEYYQKKIDFVIESRSASEQFIGEMENIDIVFAVDLFWSKKVQGIDLAIDHHHIKEEENVYANNNLLINLDQVGFTGDSNFMPASILSLVLFDYIIKRKGIFIHGMLKASCNLPIFALLDGAIEGDNAQYDKSVSKGFYIFNKNLANAVKYISTLGKDSLDLLFLVKKVPQILSFYEKIKPIMEQRSIEVYNSLISSDNQLVAGKFLEAKDVHHNGDLNIKLARGIYDACCKLEKRKVLNKRKILMFGLQEKSILSITLRFDGDLRKYNLRHLLEELSSFCDREQESMLYKTIDSGGGHNKAICIRFDLKKIENINVFYLQIFKKVSQIAGKLNYNHDATRSQDSIVNNSA